MTHLFRRLCLLGVLALLAAFAPLALPARAAGPYIVTKTADTNGTCAAGNCSLREAITAANSAPGVISFSIPTSDPGYQAAGAYWRITAGQLPPISGGNITINGLDGAGVPRIELSGGGTGRFYGLLITSANNTVKGLIINGFIADPQAGYGIWLFGSNVRNNTIAQNYIGTNYNATAAGGPRQTNNSGAGIALQAGASQNIIDGNIIAGNGGYGVYMFNSVGLQTPDRQEGNIVRNNLIGVAAGGAAALRNWNDGVFIGDNSINNVIGPNNVISGNGSPSSLSDFGLTIGGYQGDQTHYITGNRVIGNKIGTDAAGTGALPNATGGVAVLSSNGTAIGGPNGNPTTPNGDGNLIAGNSGSGIWVRDTPAFGSGMAGILIRNNWVGLKANGTEALPNHGAGVYLSASAHDVTVGPGNVISGNQDAGVLIEALENVSGSPPITADRQVRQNTITGNFIGTDASGNAAVPNKAYGVLMQGGTFGNGIAGNRIANHSAAGIYLGADAGVPPAAPTGNTISGNLIKKNGPIGIALTPGSNTNAVGLSGAGNTIEEHTSSGIEIRSNGNTLKANELRLNQIGITISSATGNTIGGATLAEGNNLHNNTLHGLFVTGSGATGNRITRTVTSANGGKGIALANGGNAPIVGASLAATPPASGLTLTGTASGCAPSCTVELFTDDAPLTDEGPAFLASAPVAGNGSFSVNLAGCKHYLIFTLTDGAGNTSEFLSPTGNIPQCVPSAPAVEITTADPQPPRSVLPGASTTYQHTVRNIGTAAGAVSVGLGQSANAWASLSGNTCQGQSLAPQATCTFALVVNVPADAQAGQQNVATITATIGAASGQQVDTTNVLVSAGLTFEPHPTPGSNAKSVGPGQPVSYQHNLTNTGNGADSFSLEVTPPSGWSFSLQPTAVNNLAAGASIIVTLTLTPTGGLAGGSTHPATITARSVADPSKFATVIDTTTIEAVAVPQIISATITPPSADPGASVVVAYNIQNAGNQAGTFGLAFSGPPGWAITQAITPSLTLAAGASGTVSTTLQVPAGAIAGAYPALLVATGQGSPSVSASRSDSIGVNQVAGLSLAPDIDDPTLRRPGEIVTYTLELANSGNFTDTVGLAAGSARGWPVRVIPAGPTLNPGASQAIQVELTIPPGQVALPANLTTITATSSLAAGPPVRATALITTQLEAVAAVDLSTSTPTQPLIDSKPVTFTLQLRNTGSITQSYNLAPEDIPAGWQATLTPTQTQVLQPNETVAVTLVLRAPNGLPNGQTYSVMVIATCRENSCEGDDQTLFIRTGPPVQLGGACEQTALPGQIVSCKHTLTNAGTVTDTIVLDFVSFLGWRTTLTPQVLVLGPGATATFTATSTVPPASPAGVLERLKIKATSSVFPGEPQEVTDTITVLQYARLSFVAGQGRPLVPGQTLIFRHTLVNTGNGLDSFRLTATQQYSWSVTITPTTTTTLAPGLTYPVTVKVVVPANAPVTAINPIVVRATSVFSPAVYDDLVNTVGVQRAFAPLIYLPVVSR